MGNVIWVGLGGFIGSVLRYLLSGLVIDNEIEEGLATLEKAQIHFYRSGQPT